MTNSAGTHSRQSAWMVLIAIVGSSTVIVLDRLVGVTGWAQAWPGVVSAILGIAGTVLIFVWGPPQPNFVAGEILEFSSSPEQQKATAELKRRHVLGSAIGLGLILLSFVLQLLSALPRR